MHIQDMMFFLGIPLLKLRKHQGASVDSSTTGATTMIFPIPEPVPTPAGPQLAALVETLIQDNPGLRGFLFIHRPFPECPTTSPDFLTPEDRPSA